MHLFQLNKTKKKIISCCFLNLFTFFLACLFSFSLSSCNLVKKDALCADLSIWGGKSEYSSLSFECSFPSEKDADNFFAAAASRPSGSYSPLLAITEENHPQQFQVSANSLDKNFCDSYFSVCTGQTFTNTKKMETLDLELVQDESQRTGKSVVNPLALGAVYIPDVFANYIIEKTPGVYKDYDDLISKKVLVYLDGQLSECFQVTNIFYTGSFKYCSSSEAYQNLDYGCGPSFFKYFGHFLVVPDRYTIFSDTKYGAEVICQPKRFIVSEILTSLFAKGKAQNVCAQVFNQGVGDLRTIGQEGGAFVSTNGFSHIRGVSFAIGITGFALFLFSCSVFSTHYKLPWIHTQFGTIIFFCFSSLMLGWRLAPYSFIFLFCNPAGNTAVIFLVCLSYFVFKRGSAKYVVGKK